MHARLWDGLFSPEATAPGCHTKIIFKDASVAVYKLLSILQVSLLSVLLSLRQQFYQVRSLFLIT